MLGQLVLCVNDMGCAHMQISAPANLCNLFWSPYGILMISDILLVVIEHQYKSLCYNESHCADNLVVCHTLCLSVRAERPVRAESADIQAAPLEGFRMHASCQSCTCCLRLCLSALPCAVQSTMSVMYDTRSLTTTPASSCSQRHTRSPTGPTPGVSAPAQPISK